MRHSTGIILLATVLARASTTTSAQSQDPDSPPADVTFHTEIVVTPERGETPRNLVAGSTVVIEGASLSELPVVHPAEVLSFLPGFTVKRAQFNLPQPVVSARGFFGGGEAEYVLLLVDGVPVADVESGLIDWSTLATASIRRIEASKGPGASLYGDSAVGGVIQILTDRPAAGGKVIATGGSFNTLTADSSYGRHSGPTGFSISGAARRTNGGLDHSGVHQLVGGGSVEGAFRGFSWRTNAAGADRRRDDPGVLSRDQLRTAPDMSDQLFRFDRLQRRNLSTGFMVSHKTEVWRPLIRLYTTLREEDLVRTIPLAPALGDRHARELSSAVIGGSLEGEHAFARPRSLVVRFGLDLSRALLDTSYRRVSQSGVIGARDSEATGHRVRSGLYASSSWEPAPRVRLSGAVRWDDVVDTGFGEAASTPRRAWSPRVGAVFQPTDSGSVRLFFQVSKAFKVPPLNELFVPLRTQTSGAAHS